jgi:hypothetical protein
MTSPEILQSLKASRRSVWESKKSTPAQKAEKREARMKRRGHNGIQRFRDKKQVTKDFEANEQIQSKLRIQWCEEYDNFPEKSKEHQNPDCKHRFFPVWSCPMKHCDGCVYCRHCWAKTDFPIWDLLEL